MIRMYEKVSEGSHPELTDVEHVTINESNMIIYSRSQIPDFPSDFVEQHEEIVLNVEDFDLGGFVEIEVPPHYNEGTFAEDFLRIMTKDE